MSVNAEQRKLAAIMFTDMVGYSSLSQRDDRLALELLEEHRELLRKIFAEFNGMEIKTIGDGFLVEFNSALEAAQCAIAIQRALAKRNADAAAERQIQVRIGVHIGDVIHRGGDVYGDGVNIASRIEQLAGAGGICVSMDVERQIRNAVETRFEKLAPTELKNISVPMDLFRIVLPWERQGGRATTHEIREKRASFPTSAIVVSGIFLIIVIALGWWWIAGSHTNLASSRVEGGGPATPNTRTLAEAPPSIPEKSIAVLPFQNLSDDKSTGYFSDGITEEILNALAQIPGLKVAARRSAFQFKGSDLDLAKIGQTLGVAHILEGSLQKAGDQVRINVQLVDVKNGLQAWSEKYDRKLDNVFAVEDEIAKAIATQLRVQLTGGAGQPLVVDSTNNLKAHELYLRGLSLLAARGPALLEARDSFQEAVGLDTGYAQAWGALAVAEFLLPSYGLDSFDASLPRADSAAKRALSLDSNTASAYVATGMANYFHCRWADADQAFRRALVLAPGDAEAVNQYAQFLSTIGQLEPSLREIERAQQLDPLSPIIGVIHAGVLAVLRRDAAAELQIKSVLAAHPDFAPALTWGAVQYIDRKMYPEAEVLLRSLGKLNGQNGDAKALLARGMADPDQRVAAVNSLEASPDNADIRRDAIWYAFYLISLGERGRALDELEIYATKLNSAFVPWLWNRGFDPLRDEPRFKAVLAKLALPYTPPAVTEP
ncbi:MAG TPA: adenylate/guanylate cyclase domain-containing protein [Candidatus Udaeobacter sp.]|jgi:TolB-like protein/class 3 adenylate cyclase/Tfp pilus assembly protein PilF|nr:adenylate/guanylate cyclase domain-containing protein [Candidatus Udaeobacter sp.]